MESQKRKGKLINASKLIVERNGEHVQLSKVAEIKGKPLTFYYHTLEFDNGDKGSARSLKPEGNFNIGHNYSYLKNEFVNGQYTNISFSNLKDLHRPAYKGESLSPEQQKEILNQVAFIAANSVLKVVVEEEYMDVYKTFRSWLYEQVIDKNENSQSISGVLKIAASYFAELEKKVKVQKVIKFANLLIEKIKDTSWESQTNTNSSSETKKQETQLKQSNMNFPKSPMTPPDQMTNNDLPF